MNQQEKLIEILTENSRLQKQMIRSNRFCLAAFIIFAIILFANKI